MKHARLAMVAALTVTVAACGSQAGTGSTGAATPAAEVTNPAPEAAVPTAAAAAVPTSNLPSGADLTVDKLPGEAATGEIKTTPSGLRYVVLKEGTGAKPTANSNVQVDYTGYLTDGTKFDSSVDRGQPAKFALNGVIPGWTEGLQLMAPGAKYKLIVPPELGYGPTGYPPVIPPNAWLVFDVDLQQVQ
jgi:peptidylprolyl isomerase